MHSGTAQQASRCSFLTRNTNPSRCQVDSKLTNFHAFRNSFIAMFQIIMLNNWNDLVFTLRAGAPSEAAKVWGTAFVVHSTCCAVLCCAALCCPALWWWRSCCAALRVWLSGALFGAGGGNHAQRAVFDHNHVRHVCQISLRLPVTIPTPCAVLHCVAVLSLSVHCVLLS